MGNCPKIPVSHELVLSLRTENVGPESLTDSTHSTRHAAIDITRQSLLHRTLRHARIVQVAETAAHARRPVTSFFC